MNRVQYLKSALLWVLGIIFAWLLFHYLKLVAKIPIHRQLHLVDSCLTNSFVWPQAVSYSLCLKVPTQSNWSRDDIDGSITIYDSKQKATFEIEGNRLCDEKRIVDSNNQLLAICNANLDSPLELRGHFLPGKRYNIAFEIDECSTNVSCTLYYTVRIFDEIAGMLR